MTGTYTYWIWPSDDLRDPRWQLGRIELGSVGGVSGRWLRRRDWATEAFRRAVQRVPPEATKSTYAVSVTDDEFPDLIYRLRDINARYVRAVNDARFAAMAEVEALGAMYVPGNPQPVDSEGDE